MFTVNKKLWSFIFGCFVAWSYMWLVGIGVNAPVPEVLSTNTDFVMSYYPNIVTATSALFLSAALVVIMKKVFNLCTSDHPFWMILPSLYFLSLSMFSAFEILPTILMAALPSLILLAATAIYYRIQRQKVWL